jgi:hypothetical protein
MSDSDKERKIEIRSEVFIACSLIEARRLFADHLCSDIDPHCDCKLCVAAQAMTDVILEAQGEVVRRTHQYRR